MPASHQVHLAARPVGEVKASDFEVVEVAVPEPGEGNFVVELTHLSIDPAMRGWMNDVRSYVPPVQIGEVMRAAGSVASSPRNTISSARATWSRGMFGVQEHAVSTAPASTRSSSPTALRSPPTSACSG